MSLCVGYSYSQLTAEELQAIENEEQKMYIKLAVVLFTLGSLLKIFSPSSITSNQILDNSPLIVFEKTKNTSTFNFENEPCVQRVLDMCGGDLSPTPAPPSNFGIESGWQPTRSLNNNQRSSGPGARARAAAMKNFRNGQSKKSTNNSVFADAFQPRTSYSHYNHYKKATSSHLSAKNVTSNEWIDNLPLNCPSRFKGGPSPFIGYQYNKDHTPQSLDFSNQKSENHLFDRHGESALNIKGNRNKETLAKTRTKLVEFASEPDTKRVEGSFRYEKPVYHYLKDSPGARAKNNLILTVDAQTNQPISVRNATKYQFDQIDRNGNLGLDARPVKPSGEEGFSVVLRLRGGPSF